MRITKKELEIQGCKKFVCPNLSLIDKKGKELQLKDSTIKRAKDLAISYFKKTYHKPHYASAKSVLPAFLYIASIIESDRRTQTEIANVCNTTARTIGKWYIDVIDTLDDILQSKEEDTDENDGQKNQMR